MIQIDDNLISFRNNLKEVLETRGINQKDLADRLGISKQTVNKYVLGETYPSFQTLIQMAIILDCSLDYLLGIDNTKNTAINKDDRITLVEKRLEKIEGALGIK